MIASSLEAARSVLARQQTGWGAHGVVAAAAPLAAAHGAAAMRDGGNAYDGALTAALCETVLLPPKCGLAGDLVAMALGPRDTAPEALLAIGGAATGLADHVARHGLETTGPMSVGVPGAPAGYAALAERGNLPRSRAARPAAALAEHGFAWSEICTTLAEESQELVARYNPDGTAYFASGRPPRPGEVVRLPGLAAALRSWAELGERLLEGPVGAAIVERVQAAGGVIHDEDLAYGTAEWVAPAVGRVGDLRLWTTPAPTHGPSLIDALETSGASGDAAQLWRSTQDAIARRAALLGDFRGGTSMVTAVDSDGAVVVVVHSNSFPRFGSGLIVDEFDLILSNRAGRGFSDNPSGPNFPAAGRRPATTLHAWAVGATTPELVGATPGGANQMTWNAQLLDEVRAGERDPGRLVTSPRWEWLPDHDGVRIERDLGEQAIAALAQVATHVELVEPWSLRSAQQVARRPEVGSARVAAVDPRTGGAVVAV